MHLNSPVWIALPFLIGVVWQIYARWKSRRDEMQAAIDAERVVEKEIADEARSGVTRPSIPKIGTSRHRSLKFEQRVRAEWGPEAAALVFAELDLLEDDVHNFVFEEAFQEKILRLSNHSLEDLKDWVRMANIDFRDVFDLANRRHSSEYRARALEQFRQQKPEVRLFSEELTERVREEWGDEDSFWVLFELKFIKESVTDLTDREDLQTKVLELSRHSMDDIKYWVQMANADFREVLWLAEPGRSPMLIAEKLEQFKQRKRKKLEAGQP